MSKSFKEFFILPLSNKGFLEIKNKNIKYGSVTLINDIVV